jgi:hypothetical protein
MNLGSENPAKIKAGDEEYWLKIYQNVARADVNRAQIKNLMFVFSKVKVSNI